MFPALPQLDPSFGPDLALQVLSKVIVPLAFLVPSGLTQDFADADGSHAVMLMLQAGGAKRGADLSFIPHTTISRR